MRFKFPVTPTAALETEHQTMNYHAVAMATVDVNYSVSVAFCARPNPTPIGHFLNAREDSFEQSVPFFHLPCLSFHVDHEAELFE
jgi:hypothetical protein